MSVNITSQTFPQRSLSIWNALPVSTGLTGGQWSLNFRPIWAGRASHTLTFKKQICSDTGFQGLFWSTDILPPDPFTVPWGKFFVNSWRSGQKRGMIHKCSYSPETHCHISACIQCSHKCIPLFWGFIGPHHCPLNKKNQYTFVFRAVLGWQKNWVETTEFPDTPYPTTP